MTGRSYVLGVLIVVVGCPAPHGPAALIPPVSSGKVHVRVFTEPSPVRMLASADRFVFSATEHELERFDDKGAVFALNSQSGLSGTQVLALGPDPEDHKIWILTDGGVGLYDTTNEVLSWIEDPPATLGFDFAALTKDGASIASALEGGAWIGTSRGLYYVSSKGGWTATAVTEPIRAIARDHAGWVWLATKHGLVARKHTGETVRIGASLGCAITEPRMVVELAKDRMLVIGTDEAGRERLAFGSKLAWTTYRALPAVTWDAATRRGTGAVALGGGRVYQIDVANANRVRPLAREGVRLVPVAGSAGPEWVIDPLDVIVPPGATSVATSGDLLLIGTRDLGTARFRDGSAHPVDWFRRKQMFERATTLSIACARADDCWIATGARQAWRWAGERFVAGGPDQVVLAVVRHPSGTIFALHRAHLENTLHLSQIDRGTWTIVPGIEITTPGVAPEISFARFAPSGALWIGLRYRDGVDIRPFGMAIVDTGNGTVTYHRTGATTTAKPGDKRRDKSRDKSRDKRSKTLQIPVGVVDADVSGDTAWFATNEGAARVENDRVSIWTEADGLRSEIIRAVAIAPNGRVLVATGAGAGIWDGKRWDFPAALQFEVHDLAATRNGQVWMATERGIAAWDGAKVRRIDTRRGLAENQIFDVVVDQFDRVWARGPGSLTLISQ